MIRKDLSVKQLHFYSICSLIKVEKILYLCGKDMVQKNDLHHWDNSHLKNAIILILCALKNQIYLVYDGCVPVATYQVKINGGKWISQKLAVLPEAFRQGIGSFCVEECERQAIDLGCHSVIYEVYDKNVRALKFFQNNGYREVGRTQTLKYQEIVVEKVLQ